MAKMQNSFISALSKITSLGSDRYVKEFKRAPLAFDRGRTILQTDKEKAAYKVFQECADLIGKAADRYPVLKELEEILFISIRDLDDLRFTAIVKGGHVETSVGWDTSKRPTLVIPFFTINLEHLKQILSDKSIDKKELYRIARVLFISFMKGLYDAEYLYTPGDKRYLKLDKLFHVEMTEMPGVKVDGFPGSAKATIANVEGEWLVFEGYQGTPRVKVTCDLDQALQYYYILMVQMKRAKNMSELKEAFEKYMKLREETVKDLYKKT
ncbi:MAG: hypothetical protein A2677_00425 [Candidatus Komeilibacteria bacterium RIFCSPHIGHO2_01_FULL_52_14]|uniref:Uncharacterized protein n=1 Tax=Candidatus Komeilibacteria bacterium RIFCSPHIGHO2_01_FULL_52_14 TaxID=1798549 RepID=A0A1G2BLT5_9BACT|nr:MAG: hypothetical protein A2677_00425 [Candidatus Komeilibacteria bacterium RIFCSPHIGHO2_01_FULL_52_14]